MTASSQQARIQSTNQRGIAAAHQGRLLDAEEDFREVCRLMESEPARHPSDLANYLVALNSLGKVLMDMQASPEAEPYRVKALTTARQLANLDSGYDSALAQALIGLAKVYRGPWIYIYPAYLSSTGQPQVITGQSEMREARRRLLASGQWPIPWVQAPHWHLKGEQTLLQLIELAESHLDDGDILWFQMLALGLNLLGEAYIMGERPDEAEAPLRSAESLYEQLVNVDPSTRDLLVDTRELLAKARQPTPAFMVMGEDFKVREGRQFATQESHNASWWSEIL